MTTATMKWFNDAKGFGFARQAGSEKDIFVHFSSIQAQGFRTLDENDVIECDLVKARKVCPPLMFG